MLVFISVLCFDFLKPKDLKPYFFISLLAVLQMSLLFSKDYGLLRSLRKSLSSNEVGIEEHLETNAKKVKSPHVWHKPSVFQFRETREKILCFLGTFLDKVSPRFKGWEKTYATDIKVSSLLLQGEHIFQNETPVDTGGSELGYSSFIQQIHQCLTCVSNFCMTTT